MRCVSSIGHMQQISIDEINVYSAPGGAMDYILFTVLGPIIQSLSISWTNHGLLSIAKCNCMWLRKYIQMNVSHLFFYQKIVRI